MDVEDAGELGCVYKVKAVDTKTLSTIVGIICLLVSPPVTAQVNAPQLWKARALQAAENAKTFESRLKSAGDWNSPDRH